MTTEARKRAYTKYNRKNKDKQKKWQQENRDKTRVASKKWKDKNKEYIKQYNKKMQIETPWIQSFYKAKQRCTNSNHPQYHNYGGRGIKLLMTKEDFEHLYYRDNGDMMDCATIDRIDNDGNYELSNCTFINPI